MNKEVRDNLFGIVGVIAQPSEVSIETTRRDLGIPAKEWDALSPCKKGKIIASSIVTNRVRTIERYYSERNRIKERERKSKKGRRSGS